MGEALPKLGGELEMLVLSNPPGPAPSDVGPCGSVERRVDLYSVEETSEILEGIEAAGLIRRVYYSLPVGIAPASRSYSDQRDLSTIAASALGSQRGGASAFATATATMKMRRVIRDAFSTLIFSSSSDGRW